MSRTATITRVTKETDLTVELELDGTGAATADTGIAFFDHMLQQLGKHAGFDARRDWRSSCADCMMTCQR